MLIDDRGIHMERLRAVNEDRLLDRARIRIIADIGTVQFPQIIVDIDKEIRISWQLQQRAPRSTQELLSVYSALLAHGTCAWRSKIMRRTRPI